MAVEIRVVETKRDLRKYVNFPIDLYKGNPWYVPFMRSEELAVLDPKKNPSFEVAESRSWLAYKEGKVAGRITGIYLKRYKEIWGKNQVRFGWVDFIDDDEVSKALFDSVENWAGKFEAESVTGPQGFTDLDPEGMLVEGFEELGTMPMIYNYSYYPEHLGRLGYGKEIDWLEYEIKTPESIPEKVRRIQELVLLRKRLRIVDAKRSKDLMPYARGLFDVLVESYKDLYGFIPLTDAQVDNYIKQYIPFADPRFTKIVIDENDRVVAFGVAMPSFSRALQKNRGRLFPFGWIHMLHAMKKPVGMDMYLIAVLPEYQISGVVSVVMGTITQGAIDAGLPFAETSGELEDNEAVQAMWRNYEHRQHKRRRCFIKDLK